MTEMPHPPYPTPALPPPSRSRAVPLVFVILVLLLIAAYALALVLTKDQWLGSASRDGTSVTFAAQAMDGSPPAPEALERTREMVAERAEQAGLADASVTTGKGTVTVTAPGDGADIAEVGRTGQLFVRPVIHAIPTQSAPASPSDPGPPAPGLATRVAEERELRQSTDPQIQMLALQFQAGRCADPDDLAGQDDPDLPLVTCSQDDSEVYLLDKAILTRDQIDSADAAMDDPKGEPLIDLVFDGDGTKTWADFTAANVGTQTAFVVDTDVISAPEIMEAIAGGRTQITGQFTEADARALASVLSNEPLPLRLILESSTPEDVAGQRPSILLRIGLLAVGAVLVAALIGGTVWLVRGIGGRTAAPGAFR